MTKGMVGWVVSLVLLVFFFPLVAIGVAALLGAAAVAVQWAIRLLPLALLAWVFAFAAVRVQARGNPKLTAAFVLFPAVLLLGYFLKVAYFPQ